MPPKKGGSRKGDASASASHADRGSVDGLAGPTNTCDFKISMELQHEAGHYLKIKYDWITVAVGEPITFAEVDTGFLKDWNLVQIEGEDPVDQEEVDPKDKKASAAAKKPPPGKGAATSKLEEITDDRPRTINYERDVSAENNGIGLEVTEDVAIKFSEAMLSLQVYTTDLETSEETLIETIQIDLSCLLYQKDSIDVSIAFCLNLFALCVGILEI